MFKNRSNTEYSILKYNDGSWYVAWTASDEEELIRLLACFCRRHLPYAYGSMQISCPVLDEINMNGNDTVFVPLMPPRSDENYIAYIRRYMITDGRGRIIDPRLYEDRINMEFTILEKKQNSQHRRPLPCIGKFRFDPEPMTGRHALRHRSHGNRKTKTWFRNFRLDRIPEYEEYVRKKAMLPDAWDCEPYRKETKSWKDNARHRCQWQKHHKTEKCKKFCKDIDADHISV